MSVRAGVVGSGVTIILDRFDQLSLNVLIHQFTSARYSQCRSIWTHGFTLYPIQSLDYGWVHQQ